MSDLVFQRETRSDFRCLPNYHELHRWAQKFQFRLEFFGQVFILLAKKKLIIILIYLGYDSKTVFDKPLAISRSLLPAVGKEVLMGVPDSLVLCVS